MIHPWQEDLWRRLQGRRARLPHALLLAGPAGLGKRDFADHFAASLLCETPAAGGHPCDSCVSCRLRLAGNHPDLHWLVPAGAEESDGEGEAPAAKAGRASTQIRIEQVRELHEALTVTSHRGGHRMVLIDPAEAMNAATANALLKLLEEPPPACVFLLISSRPAQLLPTVLSRCQRWSFPRPDARLAADWLAQRLPEGAEALLALSGGVPLAALRLVEAGGQALYARFVGDMASLPEADPVLLAGRWEDWLKAKDSLAAGFDQATLVGWLQRWVTDLASLRLGGRLRYFPLERARLEALSGRLGMGAALNCYNEFSQIRRVAQHPLNSRLFLEDLLMRYAKAFTGARP